MTHPSSSHTTYFSRLFCLILCYILATPFSTFISKPGISVASDARPSVLPFKMKDPDQKTNQTAQRARWRDGELLVRFRQNVSDSDIETLLQANGAQRAGRLRGQSGIERLHLSEGTDLEATVSILRADPSVELIETN
jgi:hypothetical protein